MKDFEGDELYAPELLERLAQRARARGRPALLPDGHHRPPRPGAGARSPHRLRDDAAAHARVPPRSGGSRAATAAGGGDRARLRTRRLAAPARSTARRRAGCCAAAPRRCARASPLPAAGATAAPQDWAQHRCGQLELQRRGAPAAPAIACSSAARAPSCAWRSIRAASSCAPPPGGEARPGAREALRRAGAAGVQRRAAAGRDPGPGRPARLAAKRPSSARARPSSPIPGSRGLRERFGATCCRIPSGR